MPELSIKKSDLKRILDEISATREEIRLLKCAILTLAQVQYSQRGAPMPETIINMFKNYALEDLKESMKPDKE
jgi:hypothetical protein